MKPTKIKPGQCFWLKLDAPYQSSVWVEVLKTGVEGAHSVKVRAVHDKNAILYCKPEDLSSRKAKAEKKGPAPVMSEEMKQTVQNRTEERMNEIMESLKEKKNVTEVKKPEFDYPDFDEVKEDLYAICTVLTDEKPDQRVRELAEAGLYEKIKYGVKKE